LSRAATIVWFRRTAMVVPSVEVAIPASSSS
jgi:hypothetical protein